MSIYYIYTAYGNIFLSDAPVQMLQENSLHIHCNLPRLRMGAIDNLSSKVLIESDIIAKIDMSGFAPYDTLTYSESSDSHFTFYLSVKELQSMRIYVTDQNNNKIPLNLGWTMSMKFIYEDVSAEIVAAENTKLLEEIRDLMKYLVLSKHME